MQYIPRFYGVLLMMYIVHPRNSVLVLIYKAKSNKYAKGMDAE